MMKQLLVNGSPLSLFILLLLFLSLPSPSSSSVTNNEEGEVFIPKLYYFDIKGKAEGIRLACHYAHFEIEDVRLTQAEFDEMKSNGRLQFGQVPALEVREGVVITQSKSILRFIGKKSGLYPKDDELAAMVDAIADQETDMLTGLTVARFPTRYGFGELLTTDESLLKQIFEDIMTENLIRHLQFFENLLSGRIETGNSSPWLARTDSPTIADFTVFPRILDLQERVIEKMGFDVLLIFPHLKYCLTEFYDLAEIKNYYTSQQECSK